MSVDSATIATFNERNEMPNWVYNGLTAEGNPESVKKMMEQLNTPFSRVHEQWNMQTGQMEKQTILFPNPVFSFWNIIKPTDIDAYEKQTDHVNAPSIDNFGEYMKWTSTQNDWYNWNINNWGTKWDVAVSHEEENPNTYMEDAVNGENHVVYYNFNTAWSRPMPALIKLSEQYPDLLFTLTYEEETGWGGELELLRGVVISESEYDDKCRECEETDCLEFNEEKEVMVCLKCGYES
jgi:hypothetical protein